MGRTPDITNFNKGAIFVKPGSSVGFTAKIENVTTNSTAQFLGINAAKSLNALGGKLTTGDGKSAKLSRQERGKDPAEERILAARAGREFRRIEDVERERQAAFAAGELARARRGHARATLLVPRPGYLRMTRVLQSRSCSARFWSSKAIIM